MLMRHVCRAVVCRALAVPLLVAGLAGPAVGQALLQGSTFTRPQDAGRKPDETRPSGLPGARGGQVRAAPAERPAAEMGPTEALFDAVNRGDVAAARDAIGRGAELEGRNILGLTPIELAIDLGRNEMTFLLLSMRGMATGAPSGPADAAPPPRSTAARAASVQPTPTRAAQAVAGRAEPMRRRQDAGASGTPMPAAGFLGFGSANR